MRFSSLRALPSIPILSLLLATGALVSCTAASPAPSVKVEGVVTATAADYAPAPRDPTTARVAVIGFSDFHGWLLPLEPKDYNKYYGGVANIAAMLRNKERIDREPVILLDNGDMWTGPTESTLLRGEPVIQVYNALGLTAANIANHEFDFGQEVLQARVGEARFPFLGANLVKAGTTQQPSFVKPWIIVERDGVKIGIVGLSFIDTPKTTLAKHVAGLEFLQYADTLKRVVPEVRAAGADAVVLLFHDTADVVKATLEQLPDLAIAAVIAGQNHRKSDIMVGQTPVVNPGPFGRSYVRFDLKIDRAQKKLTGVEYAIVDVSGEVGSPPYPPASEMLALVESARQKAKQLSGEVLGKVAQPLPQGTFADSPLGHLITDAWLAALPHADFAICNHGAIRQPLAAGPVTVGDVLAVLPFENNLYVVKLTGKQLKRELTIDGPVVSGLTWRYREDKKGRTVVSAVDRVGRKIEDGKEYRVVINDFMYFGGDGFTFKQADPAPEDSGLSLREPVMRALRLSDSAGRPLEPPSGARAAKVR